MKRVPDAQGSRFSTSKSIKPTRPQKAVNEVGVETVRNSVRVIEIITSRHGERKTITELHMLADLIGK